MSKQKTYTVIGIWLQCHTRFAESYVVDSPEEAEESAINKYCPDDPQDLLIAGVIEGAIIPVA